MKEPQPDTRLLQIITERDALKEQLRVERIRAAQLQRRVAALTGATRTSDAKPPPPPAERR